MKLPRDVSGVAEAKALRRLGFEISRQSGSHLTLKKGARTVVIPQHRAIKPGTLKGLIEQAGISTEELIRNL